MANSKTSFDDMKFKVAREVGINLSEGYNGNITAKDAGKIGGTIVKKVFESYTNKAYK